MENQKTYKKRVQYICVNDKQSEMPSFITYNSEDDTENSENDNENMEDELCIDDKNMENEKDIILEEEEDLEEKCDRLCEDFLAKQRLFHGYQPREEEEEEIAQTEEERKADRLMRSKFVNVGAYPPGYNKGGCGAALYRTDTPNIDLEKEKAGYQFLDNVCNTLKLYWGEDFGYKSQIDYSKKVVNAVCNIMTDSPYFIGDASYNNEWQQESDKKKSVNILYCQWLLR